MRRLSPWVGLVAVLVLAESASAEVRRLRWRGVVTDGVAPARLAQATESHLQVSLRHLGIALAAAIEASPDAEGGARCTFTAAKLAQCVVDVVQRADLRRSERRAEVPFRDAEDLGASLALLLGDLVQSDFPGLVQNPAGAVDALPLDVEPRVTPHPGPSPSASPSPSPVRPPTVQKPYKPLGPSRVFIEIGPSVVVGFNGEPTLFGGSFRALWASGPLRAGGSLSVAGTNAQIDTWDLSFTRLLTGPRVGVGLRRGRLDLDLTAGPALYVFGTDAHIKDGTHSFAAFAVMAGGRLSIALVPSIALHLGADLVATVTEGRITAGERLITAFSHGSAEITLGLAYHR